MANKLKTNNRDYPWCPKLEFWEVSAAKELGYNPQREKKYALFPRSWLRKILRLRQQKTLDYNFIGSYAIDDNTRKNREWVIKFAYDNFSSKSLLHFTDNKSRQAHEPLGIFDITTKKKGFSPKEHPVSERMHFDSDYYEILSKSNYTLCPNGDSNWSMRFYEAIACLSIPILPDDMSFRTEQERKIGYHYFKPEDNHFYSEHLAAENFKKFIDNHVFSDIGKL